MINLSRQLIGRSQHFQQMPSTHTLSSGKSDAAVAFHFRGPVLSIVRADARAGAVPYQYSYGDLGRCVPVQYASTVQYGALRIEELHGTDSL